VSRWEKLAGTVASWFGLGGEEEVAVGKDASGNLVFKDQVVSGTPTLSELVAASEGDDQVKEKVEDGDTFRVKEDHQHIVNDTFTTEGSGVYIVEGTSVIFGGSDPQAFDAFDGAGGTVVGASWVDVPLTNVATPGDVFQHSTPEPSVVVLVAGRYLVSARCGTTITSGTSRTDSRMRIAIDTGSGFAELSGSRAAMYNRTLNLGEDSASVTRILSLAAGDRLKVQAQLANGGSSLALLANASGLTLQRLG